MQPASRASYPADMESDRWRLKKLKINYIYLTLPMPGAKL